MWAPLTTLLTLPALLVPVLAVKASPSALTCPYRTVNYITHSLPQQCLTSSRRANITTSPTEIGDTAAATLTAIPVASIQASNSSSVKVHDSVTSTVADSESSPMASATESIDLQSTSSSVGTQTASSATGDAADDVSPLEDGKFLSFEDWKRENLKKSGQSEHVAHRAGAEHVQGRKRPPVDQDSLDSFGDDAEIDFSFSGFVPDGLEPGAQTQPYAPQQAFEGTIPVEPGRAPKLGLRSKDAGKTYKERSNYASFDCGAEVRDWNSEAKSVTAILGKNKDSYMLNECSATNKYVVLALCDDIAIDTIVVANFEFFSSIFRTFRVSVSDKYPIKIDKWKTIGTFEARNSREIQAFLVENPVIWARWVRIEFLTHYGSEYYCPVSLVRVHGTTMLEEYKHDMDSWQNEDDEDQERFAQDHPENTDGFAQDARTDVVSSTSELSASDLAAAYGSKLPVETPIDIPQNLTSAMDDVHLSSENPAWQVSKSPSNSSVLTNDLIAHAEVIQTCRTGEQTSATTNEGHNEQVGDVRKNTEDSRIVSSTSSIESSSSTKASASVPKLDNLTTNVSSFENSTTQSGNSTVSKVSSVPSSVNGTKISASSTQAPHAAPTMQESFFKSVQKRLQMLESNSSLSLQYIEEQSRALRDAFQKVEQRQLAKTTSFLDYLNTTVLNELRDFRQQYDQLWQSTVIELELQRERYQQEHLAINARLGVLADEVIFQKRMSILQMILILICLGLVLFSKGALNSYLELPLLQNVLSRSPSARWLNLSGMDTPTQSPPVTRMNSTRGGKRQGILKGHRRMPSEESTDGPLSPVEMYSPATPVSFGETSDEERENEDDKRLGDPQFDPSLIERPSTSPPFLPGSQTSTASESEMPASPIPVTELGNGSIDALLQPSTPRQKQSKPPILVVEDATPPPKHLKWQLPES